MSNQEQVYRLYDVPEITANGRRIEGYVAVFNALSRPMGNVREVIRRGAFTEALQRGGIYHTYNHNKEYTLANEQTGTVAYRQDDHGLWFSAELPDTTYARDMVAKINHKLTRGNSFGMWTDKRKFWTEKTRGLHRQEGDTVVREYHAIDLFETSTVDEPTWLQTDVAVRSFDEWQELDLENAAKHEELARKLIGYKIRRMREGIR